MRPIYAISNDRDISDLWELWRLAEAMIEEFGRRFGPKVSLYVRGQETSNGSQGHWLVFEGDAGKSPSIPDDMRESCNALCKDLWRRAKKCFQEHELDRLQFCARGSIVVAFCYKGGCGGIPEKYLVFT